MKKTAHSLRKKFSSLVVLAYLVALISPYFLFLSPVYATAPTVAYIRFDRLSTGADISGTVCLNTTTSGTDAKIVITFPTGWTVSTTSSDWTTTTTSLPSGATAWPTIGATATSASGQDVTFSSGDLSSSTLYCFNFAGANSTLGTAGSDKTGSFITETSGDVAIDTINYATAVTSSGGDQISVTASVPTTFSFSLSGSTAALGTLSSSAVTSATGITATVGTNARNGWIAWVKNTGLTSTAAGTSIDAAGAYGSTYDLSSVTGYGLDVNSGTGSPTIDTAYNGSGDSDNVGTLATTFKQIASQSAPAAADTVTLRFRAKIPAIQAAASDYTDTVTVTAAGNF